MADKNIQMTQRNADNTGWDNLYPVTKDNNVIITDPNNRFTGTRLDQVLDELFTFANDGKTGVATVIGSPATTGDTFSQLVTHIQNAKNTMATNLTAKGISASGTETLQALAEKIANVNTGKKWAIGTIQSSSSYGSSIYSSSGALRNYHTAQVTGLTFKPSFILLKLAQGNPNDHQVIYDARFHADYRISLVFNKTTTGPVADSVKEAGKIVVSSSGFTLPVTNANTSFEWIAIE